MKKLLKYLLIAFLTVGALTACSTAPEEDPEPAEEKMKVAFYINGNLGDKSFFDSAKVGLDAAVAEHGIEVKIVEGGSDDTKWQPGLLDLADGDYDIIIVGTWQMEANVQEAAELYPDTKFIIFDTTVPFDGGKNANVYSIQYKQNEGSYIAGYLAAKMTKTGVIGGVGGMNIPVINDFFVGYIEGAKLANPDIKVAISYIDSFVDSAKGKELALAQFNSNKADVIFQVAGNAGMGVLEAAAEAGFYGIGVDSDQAALLAEAGNTATADVIPTSVLKDVGASLKRAIDLALEDKVPWGSNETLGFEANSVGIAKNQWYETLVSAELRAELETIEADIRSGAIKVSSAMGMSTEDLDAIKASVQP